MPFGEEDQGQGLIRDSPGSVAPPSEDTPRSVGSCSTTHGESAETTHVLTKPNVSRAIDSRHCARTRLDRGRARVHRPGAGEGGAGPLERTARAAGFAHCALPRFPALADPDGVDLPARGGRGASLAEGQREARGRSPGQGSPEAELGCQCQVPGQLPAGAEHDERAPELDPAARKRRARPAEGSHGSRPATSLQGQ